VKKQKTFASSVQTSATNVRQNVANTTRNIVRSARMHVKNVRKNAGKWRHNHSINTGFCLCFFSTLIKTKWKTINRCKHWFGCPLHSVGADRNVFHEYSVCQLHHVGFGNTCCAILRKAILYRCI